MLNHDGGAFALNTASSTPLGIFDARVFPEIVAHHTHEEEDHEVEDPIDRSSGYYYYYHPSSRRYVSPIHAITQEIRRRNPAVAAAAASTTSASSMMMMGEMLLHNHNNASWRMEGGSYHGNFDYTDPWDEGHHLSSHDNHPHSPIQVFHPTPGAAAATPLSSLSLENAAAAAGTGTAEIERMKQQQAKFTIISNNNCNVVTVTSRSSRYMLGEPQHVQALLHVTPHLRILCSASSTDLQGGGGGEGGGMGATGGGGAKGEGAADRLRAHHYWVGGFPLHHSPPASSTSTRSAPAPSDASSSYYHHHVENHHYGNHSNHHEYKASVLRQQAHVAAARELASLLGVLAHEMTVEEYGMIEAEVFSAVFALVHASSSSSSSSIYNKERRMAGLAAVDALLATPSADEEKKAIKFANTLSNGLRNSNGGDYEFLSAVAKALGHMAKRTANVDFVESEVTRALEWLSTDRSDRRLAACLTLKELALNAPTTFHSKTSQNALGQGGGGSNNAFLNHIFSAIRDPQPIVRAAAADALSQCLKILVERKHSSLTGLLCRVYFDMMEGLRATTDTTNPHHNKKKKWAIAVAAAEASQHGSLLVVGTVVAFTKDFMIPRIEEVCREVMKFTSHPKALMRLEAVRLIPRLARRIPKVFGRRFLDTSLTFLLESASPAFPPKVGVDIRPSAFTSIGLMIVSLKVEDGEVVGASMLPTLKIRDDPDNVGGAHIVDMYKTGIIYEKLPEIFRLVCRGLTTQSGATTSAAPSFTSSVTRIPALHCAAHLVEGLGVVSIPYMGELINDMFSGGLSSDLIRCLHSIAQSLPAKQSEIEERILQEVSFCLAGMKTGYDPLASSFHPSSAKTHTERNYKWYRNWTANEIKINWSVESASIKEVVLSLQTIAFFSGMKDGITMSGTIIPILPFVQDVVAQYLVHPSCEVRRVAALTCCALLICPGTDLCRVGRCTGVIIEDVLGRLLQVAASDPSPIVRLCVVRALDSRFDTFLCQNHHLQELFVLLQDEAVATRGAVLRVLGRLALLNPAPILPVLRRLLDEMIIELQCGVDSGKGREDATRLLVTFLQAKSLQILIPPVLDSLVTSFPLTGTVPSRLASASLEALGVLAVATGSALQPYLSNVVPHVLEIMQDQSSSSKQKTSLRTLGQIAGATGYVIQPYLDYPELLNQATDILPATKRAPWSLRREVIRTLGILGAVDPDKLITVSRKGGAVGGAYFEELNHVSSEHYLYIAEHPPRPKIEADENNVHRRMYSQSDTFQIMMEKDEDLPAFLSMYEQYTMTAQPLSTLPPAKRLDPSDDAFFPTVAIQALMRIFRDHALVTHHGMVIQAVMFLFKSLGIGCVPYLRRVVPTLIVTVRTCNSSILRDALLKQLVLLSTIAREHLRPYVADMLDVVEQFWSSRHLAAILSLVSKLAVSVPDEFLRFVPRLVNRLLMTIEEIQVNEWVSESQTQTSNKARTESEKLSLIIRSVSNLRGVLGDYLHVLIPSFLKLADALASPTWAGCVGLNDTLLDLSALLYRTISVLLESQSAATLMSSNTAFFLNGYHQSLKSSENGLASRVVQPLTRILRDKHPNTPSIGLFIVETLCVCARLIGGSSWLKLYDGLVRQAIKDWQDSFPTVASAPSVPSPPPDERLTACSRVYDESIELILQSALQQHQNSDVNRKSSQYAESSQLWIDSSGMNFELSDAFDVPSSIHLAGLQMVASHRINQSNLQRAWDVSHKTSREDWDEWMRRFAIQLLREAPSPALRATANLAHAYQPLARELFSAAFFCCWKELTEPYRVHLVHALESAFVADVSPEILQALLNLAEFMEHDPSGGLPIDIPILAELALKCQAYAKALHYREREYTLARSNSCVESLISINQKLDLPDAALGVLKASLDRDSFEPEDCNAGELEFSRNHHACDMSYSILWNTDERSPESRRRIDLSTKQEMWLVRLGNWSEALSVYREKLDRNPNDFDSLLGCMRCLDATSEWMEVIKLFNENLLIMSVPSPGNQLGLREDIAPRSKRKALRMCANAAWRLGQWEDLDKFATELVRGPTLGSIPIATSQTAFSGNSDAALRIDDYDAAFFTAICRIHRRQWQQAAEAIDSARNAMDGRLTALMAESYSRAYPSMVTAQTLAEMEEIIEFRQAEERLTVAVSKHASPYNNPTKERLFAVWRDRLAGCRVDAEVHASIIAVRSLVLGPIDGLEDTIRLSSLSYQAQRYSFAENVLLRPLAELKADIDDKCFGFGMPERLRRRIEFGKTTSSSLSSLIELVVVSDLTSIVPEFGHMHNKWSNEIVEETGGLKKLVIQHRLYFEYVKLLWLTGRRDEALARIEKLSDVVDVISHCEPEYDNGLRAACLLDLGEWRLSGAPPSSNLDEHLQLEVLTSYKRATLVGNCGYRAWHAWALLNFRIAVQMNESTDFINIKNAQEAKRLKNHVVAAVQGFVNAICLGAKKESASVQQDLLNLLTCIFQYGSVQDVAKVISEGVVNIALEAWLGVLPQMLARIHIKDPLIRGILHPLLIRLGERHPQALMYPLSVLLKSPGTERKNAAESLMNTLKAHSNELVEQALMVSSELIRVAIIWLETWHEGLEDASTLYFVEGNVAGMLDILVPLHKKVEAGAETWLESDFLKNFGQELSQAHIHIKEYVRLVTEGGSSIPVGRESMAQNRHTIQSEEAEAAMNRAWDIYYAFFRRVNKSLPSLTLLELKLCSPALSRARNLELGVPGSYRVDGSYVKISKFIDSINVITSKQRPRKITIRGSDGNDYMFLLKGHEDLRQDERVMQLFGFVNALLVLDPQTKKHDLRILRYAICPLSHNCGVIGLVPHCDLLHGLIRDYRQSKKIPLNMENREMQKIAPEYDMLTVMQKVEVFTEALRRTTGQGNDLYEILWLKSTNSEEWLERRTKYTRSLAVMSIVGYVLGLGDRHPSNLMIDKVSGRVLHIDFGDCFEVAMMREKFPERVPFRLTRMLIKAMEVSGIEGSYRSTCERVMSVLRASRDSLVAMLEAFVYDPLISWRLVDLSPGGSLDQPAKTHQQQNRLLLRDVVAEGSHGGCECESSLSLQSSTARIDFNDQGRLPNVSEHANEDNDELEINPPFSEELSTSQEHYHHHHTLASSRRPSGSMSSRSMRMYSNIQMLAANVSNESRIASLTEGISVGLHGSTGEYGRSLQEDSNNNDSMSRSRVERSTRQRELLNLLEGAEGAAHEEILNEKALKVIHRVQDKLAGTDVVGELSGPTDVTDQVQRLIVQATSSENLCQLFVGWCAFW